MKHVVGKCYYRVFGMPLNMTMRSVSAQLYREIGWAALPIREIVRPTARTATWVVTADEPPSEPRFFARFGGSRAANVVSIEAEESKTRGRIFAPNKGTRPQPSGPRYFNPYMTEQDDHEMAMADESGAETVHYDDENDRGQNLEGVFESAQESSDGAWGLASRSIRKKGKSKGGKGGANCGRAEQGGPRRVEGDPSPTPATLPRTQLNVEGGDFGMLRQDAGVVDLIAALREELRKDSRQREEEANRRYQEQIEYMRRLENTSGTHTTNLLQLNVQTATLNAMFDDLNIRVKAIESSAAMHQGGGAAAVSAGHLPGPADVAVPVEDADRPENLTRGRKGMREESPMGADGDSRPSKRHAQEDFESAADGDNSNQL